MRLREVMGIRAWGNEGGEADEDSEGGVVVGWVRRRRKQEKRESRNGQQRHQKAEIRKYNTKN